REVVARQSNVCTNHFHLLDEENRYRQDESRRREKAISDQQQPGADPYQAYRIMNDPQYDIFSYKYDAAAGTLHTAAYFPNDMTAWFVMGPDRPPVIFDFNQWLEGRDMHITR